MALNPAETAFLTLDIQKALTDALPNTEPFISNASKAVEFARKKNFQIIHVGLGFAKGHPEISDVESAFLRVKQNNLYLKDTPSTEFHSATFQSGDLVVYKQRVSAFSENELQVILRSCGIKNLVLLGLSTSGIVLATVTRAFDLDFRLFVLEDACYDPDPEVHRVLTTKIFSKRGRVATVDAFIADQERDD